MKRNLKKNEGITLISLVVTIIVLIILAGVSINLILGQDGIINKAKEAKQNIEYAKVEEETRLNELYGEMTEISDGSYSYDVISKLVEFKKEIASAITDMGVSTSEEADASTMASNIRNIHKNASDISYDNSNSELQATTVQNAVDEISDSLNSFKDISNQITIGSYDTNFLKINNIKMMTKGHECIVIVSITTLEQWAVGANYDIVLDGCPVPLIPKWEIGLVVGDSFIGANMRESGKSLRLRNLGNNPINKFSDYMVIFSYPMY